MTIKIKHNCKKCADESKICADFVMVGKTKAEGRMKADKTYQLGRLSEQKFVFHNIICNFKNPLVSRVQLNIKTGATK